VQAVAWIVEVALPKVPAEFRNGFLNRTPVSRTMLATASRRLRR
jgi:hypothetical protein